MQEPVPALIQLHRLSKDDIENEYVNCRICREARRPATKRKNKKRYEEAKRKKICVICKRNKPIEGIAPMTGKPYTICAFCYERRQEYRQQTEKERVEMGLCPCGNVRKDKKLKYCESCRSDGSGRSSESWSNRA